MNAHAAAAPVMFETGFWFIARSLKGDNDVGGNGSGTNRAVSDQQRPKVDSIMSRYADAYQKAHFIDRLGLQVKTPGVVAAILEFLIIVARFGAIMGDRSVALFSAACFAVFI